MGWAYGRNDEGREVGYGLIACCDMPNCYTIIDRGMAYMCGNIITAVTFGGQGPGCGKYFCSEHEPTDVHRCTHPEPECMECGEPVPEGDELCARCLGEGVALEDVPASS